MCTAKAGFETRTCFAYLTEVRNSLTYNDLMVFYAAFNSISVISHYSCLSWASPVLGWDPQLYFTRKLPRKNLEDQVQLKHRTPGL